jgi:hypothetical protein
VRSAQPSQHGARGARQAPGHRRQDVGDEHADDPRRKAREPEAREQAGERSPGADGDVDLGRLGERSRPHLLGEFERRRGEADIPSCRGAAGGDQERLLAAQSGSGQHAQHL